MRTTHLTGLFTDLGIDLSQLLFYKENEQQTKLRSAIKLRFRIIFFFFIGGILGGILYPSLQLFVLLFPATMLIIGLFDDNARFRLLKWQRRNRLCDFSNKLIP